MNGTERISAGQVASLIVLSRVTLTVVYYGSDPVVQQDVWWDPLFSASLVILFAWVLNRLWIRFPGHSFGQLLEAVLGRVLGRVVLAIYALFFLLCFSLNIRLTGGFFLFTFLPRTPLIVIMGVMVLLATWAARAGVEVIARAGQVVLPLLVISLSILFVVLLKDVQPRHLWPPQILTTGPWPHLKEWMGVVARTIEYAWVTMLLPWIGDVRSLFRASAWAQLTQAVLWVVMGVLVIGVIGQDITPHYVPFFAAARMASFADFLERIDAIVLAVWVLGMMLRCGLFLLGASLAISQLLGLSQYRPVVLPLAALGLAYAEAQADSFPEIQGYMAPEVATPFFLTYVWLVPYLILVVAVARRVRAPAGAPQGRKEHHG